MSTADTLTAVASDQLWRALQLIACGGESHPTYGSTLAKAMQLSLSEVQAVLDELVRRDLVRYLSPRGVVSLTPLGFTCLQTVSGERFHSLGREAVTGALRVGRVKPHSLRQQSLQVNLRPLVEGLSQCMASLYPIQSKHDAQWDDHLDELARLLAMGVPQAHQASTLGALSDIAHLLATDRT